MSNQQVPSTPQGDDKAEIVNVLEKQWRKGACAGIPVVPSEEFDAAFTEGFS